MEKEADDNKEKIGNLDGEVDEQTATELLSKRQMEAIFAIIDSPNISAGLKLAGISRSTFYRWMKNPAFRREFNMLINERYNAACIDFLNLEEPAVHALFECLQSQNENLKFKTAMGVITHMIKLQEFKNREKLLEKQEKKADEDALKLSPWSYIQTIMENSIFPQPLLYSAVSKLRPSMWKRIVSMDLSEEEWQALFDTIGNNDGIAIHATAFKCLYDLVCLSDREAPQIFAKLWRLVDDVSDDNGAIWGLWLKLVLKVTTFKPPKSEMGLSEKDDTEGSKPPAPQRLKKRFIKPQSLCEPTPSPGA